MSLFRSGIVVAVFTFISRVCGYIRDILMASILGTTEQADAFAVAFKLPNFFRTIFAEGAFSASFIPEFSGRVIKDKDLALNFANKVFTSLLIIVSLICLVFIMFMPQIMSILAPGFKHHSEKFQLVVNLAYFTIPYLLFISLSTLQAGVLNSFNHFASASSMPIILNLLMILSLTIYNKFSNNGEAAFYMAYAVLAAGISQYLFIWFSAKYFNLNVRFSINFFDVEVKMLLKRMLPAILGSSVVQINLWVGTIIASKVDGAVSYLYYAERLNQFPLAIIGTAIATVILPKLAKQIRLNNISEASTTQNRAFEFALFLALPCATAFLCMGYDIISTLFERDAFLSSDSKLVTEALQVLALGLPAFILAKILLSRFFANNDTKTPLVVSIISVAFNIVINLLLIDEYKHVGIAIGTSISSWIQVIICLSVLLYRKMFDLEIELFKRVIKIVLSSLAMFFLVSFIKEFITSLPKITSLFLQVIIGGCVYLLTCLILRVYKINELKKMLKR